MLLLERLKLSEGVTDTHVAGRDQLSLHGWDTD